MKLNVKPRTEKRKGDTARLRRAGKIPAVIYHKGEAGESIIVSSDEFSAGLRELPKGRLATTICQLDQEGKSSLKVLVKDIQYHPVSYDVLHLDFEELKDNTTVKVNVPLVISGTMDSVGVKQGGMVRQVIRQLRVECLPKDIPSEIEVDVRNMEIGNVKKLSDLSVSNEVRPLMKLESVAVTMVKR